MTRKPLGAISNRCHDIQCGDAADHNEEVVFSCCQTTVAIDEAVFSASLVCTHRREGEGQLPARAVLR